MKVTPVRYTESQVLTAMHKCELLIQLFKIPNDFSAGVPESLETMLSALFFLVPKMAALEN